MIEKSELAALAKSLGATVREYVAAAVVGFLTRDQLEERLKQLPLPLKGDKGESIKGEKGDPGGRGERGEKGDHGIQGERGAQGEPGVSIKGDTGERGERGDRGDAGLTVIGPKGDTGPSGKDGRDGVGKDALEIQILHEIPEKHPALGTWARGNGGLWRLSAVGWEIIVDGISSFEVRMHEDQRTFSFDVTFASGPTHIKTFTLPVMLFRDIFKEGTEYSKGDVVVADYSSWCCQVESTKARPGVSPDWRLIAKKGTSGKDGKDGERGPQGPEGKPGRDARMQFETSR